MKSNSLKWWEEKLFKWNQSINAYGAQSRKEKRLLCESMFVPTDKKNLTIKNDGKKSFSYETDINVIYPNEDNEFMVPNHEKKGDYYMNLCLSQLINEI